MSCLAYDRKQFNFLLVPYILRIISAFSSRHQDGRHEDGRQTVWRDTRESTDVNPTQADKPPHC